MANQAPFDLDNSVTQWKNTVSKDPSFTKENIDELEDHLLDEIQNLNRLGLAQEESFMIAKRRIGEFEVLGQEYGKINKKIYFYRRVLPYLKGMLCFLAFSKFLKLLATLFITITAGLGLDSKYQTVSILGLLFFVSMGVFFFVFNLYRKVNSNMTSLIGIPSLVGVILISESLLIFARNILVSTVGIEYFTQLQINLFVYHLVLLIGLLTFSYIAFLANKKEQKISLAH